VGVIRRDAKYVYWPEFDYEQMFDLTRDPLEMHNLAPDPAHAGRRAAMRGRLQQWQTDAR
jgi:hypothetical protein